MDLYFTEKGDIRVAPNGDLALTDTTYRHLGQQAHIRMMTELGDYLLYPRLGASLSNLYGMPQSEATGEYGKELITSALEREGVFAGQSFTVAAFPTSPTSIRFDVHIKTNTSNRVVLSIEKNLRMEEG